MFFYPVWADECLQYKITPKVSLDVPNASINVSRPTEKMSFWHGNVLATLVDNYELITDMKNVDGGTCVWLKKVKAQVGYKDFLVHIDARHTPESCGYNAILNHEKKHIAAYMSVMDDMKKDIKVAIADAADFVMPVFVPYGGNFAKVIDGMNMELRAHPNLILMKQRIQAAQEIRNNQIDIHENGADLTNCAK